MNTQKRKTCEVMCDVTYLTLINLITNIENVTKVPHSLDKGKITTSQVHE